MGPAPPALTRSLLKRPVAQGYRIDRVSSSLSHTYTPSHAQAHQVLVLSGATGSGKSTQVRPPDAFEEVATTEWSHRCPCLDWRSSTSTHRH